MTKTPKGKSSRSKGDGPETSDSEEWGFDSQRKGMSTPGKIGLTLAVLLVSAFAFVAYNRLHKQDDLVAQIRGMVEDEVDDDANPGDSQSPPAQTVSPTNDGTRTASTPDGSYRSRTATGKVSPADSSTGSRSAFGEPTTSSTTADGSGIREPGTFSDPGRRTPAADFSSSSPASDTRTTGYTTSADGSQPDPFAGDRTSGRDARTTNGDGGDNPFGLQSEPSVATADTDGTADTQTGRTPLSDSGTDGTSRSPAGGDRSPSSADAGPGPFGSRVAADATTGETPSQPRSAGVAGDELTNPWDSSPAGRPQQTTTETSGTGTSDSPSGSDRRSVTDSDTQDAIGRADQGGSGAATSTDTSADFGTSQTSPETSTAPWETRSVSSAAASTGRVDPAGSDSSSSPSPSPAVRGVLDPFESTSPQSGGSMRGGEFGPSRPEPTHSEQPRPIVYVVQTGDNYWSISKKLYGTGRYFTALARYNKPRISDPRRMRPGIQILVPSRRVLETRYPDLRLKSTKPRGVRLSNAKTPQKQLPAGFFRDASGDPMYRIGARDTLSGIAVSHLGRSSRWIQIRTLNRDRLQGAANLKIGTVLRLPADASQVQMVREPRDVR